MPAIDQPVDEHHHQRPNGQHRQRGQGQTGHAQEIGLPVFPGALQGHGQQQQAHAHIGPGLDHGQQHMGQDCGSVEIAAQQDADCAEEAADGPNAIDHGAHNGKDGQQGVAAGDRCAAGGRGRVIVIVPGLCGSRPVGLGRDLIRPILLLPGPAIAAEPLAVADLSAAMLAIHIVSLLFSLFSLSMLQTQHETKSLSGVRR